MKVVKFWRFVSESVVSAHTYVESALNELETRLRDIFENEDVDSDKKVKKFSKTRDEDGENKISLSDMGISLQSLEVSKYSKIYDNIKLKFSDEKYLYDLTFTLDLKDAVEEESQDNDTKEIEKCQIIFKKYDLDTFDMVLGPKTKEANIKDIDEDFLINLKIEFEEGLETDDDFEIDFE